MRMLRNGLPLTRERYVTMAWHGRDPVGEEEGQIPEPLRDR